MPLPKLINSTVFSLGNVELLISLGSCFKSLTLVNDNFVAVFYLADQDNLPPVVQNYFTGSTPTILFLKPYFSFKRCFS